MTQELKPRIVVCGVGGAGGNAVDNMIAAELRGVEFVVANTDSQALARSKSPNCIQLGPETTAGLGAGARPDVGAAAAEESREEIAAILDGAHMVFVAAGMGGGTGTGAAPVIARAAHERGILTVAVVTKPFGFEGSRRMKIAEDGLDNIRRTVDTMIVVPNQNLFRIANERTTFADAFRMADNVLYAGVRGITDLMVMPGLINLDFADVRAIMSGMGSAMMGMGEGEGEGRAMEAARSAVDNPLLDDVTLNGARGLLINITGGYDMTLFELDEAANEIRSLVDPDANIILGSAFDPDLEGRIRVSVVATGLDGRSDEAIAARRAEVVTLATLEPVPADLPRVVAPAGARDSFETIESDPRPDFRGRPLPPAHIVAQEGEDQVTADMALMRRTADGERDSEAGDGGHAGFANLFGWRRNAQEPGESEGEPAPSVVISGQDDHAEPTPFDDEDLEIPAFLRRSANH